MRAIFETAVFGSVEHFRVEASQVAAMQPVQAEFADTGCIDDKAADFEREQGSLRRSMLARAAVLADLVRAQLKIRLDRRKQRGFSDTGKPGQYCRTILQVAFQFVDAFSG